MRSRRSSPPDPAVATRFTRAAILHDIRRSMRENLGYGLMLEGAATLDFGLSQ
jgi:hypothetical protein